MKSQIVSIQILRGLAALLVVIAHIVEHPTVDYANAALITGRFGVEIFFVVSGFVILHIAGEGRFDPVTFAVRRVARIVPLYWACTVAVFALVTVAPSVFKSTVADGGHFLRSLAFVPSADPLDPSDWRPLFKLGWTLDYEMFFYLVLGLLFWCGSALRRAQIATAVFAVLIAASFFVTPRASVAAYYANHALAPFVVGMWLSILWDRGVFGARGAGRPALLATSAAVAAGFTAWLYARPFETTWEVGGHAVMAAAAVAIVATGLFAEAWYRDGRLPALRRIGDVSYSLYLTHMFVVGAAWAVAGRLGLVSTPALVGVGVAALVASLVLAELSFRLIESPTNAWGHRFRRRSASASGGSVSIGLARPAAR